MGTEILRPQDILIERLRIHPTSSSSSSSVRKFYYGHPPANSKPVHRKPSIRSNRSRRSTSDVDLTTSNRINSNNLSLGHVSILRRGESLDTTIKRRVSDEMRSDLVYAGSAFFTSPSPSSLPLPSFSTKKKEENFDDSATRDLRRLLRLE